MILLLKEIFENANFEKSQQMTTKALKLPSVQRVNNSLESWSSWASDFFQDWWAVVIHGAKNSGSFSEMKGPSRLYTYTGFQVGPTFPFFFPTFSICSYFSILFHENALLSLLFNSKMSFTRKIPENFPRPLRSLGFYKLTSCSFRERVA